MATQITNYQCPGCTGPLQFSAATGKLECEYCGSSYSAEEIEALYQEKNEQAEAAVERRLEAGNGTRKACGLIPALPVARSCCAM